MKNIRKWSDDDHRLGPFTFAYDRHYRSLAMVLSSAEEDYPGCSFRMSGFGCTIIVELPNIIKPQITQVKAQAVIEHRRGSHKPSAFNRYDNQARIEIADILRSEWLEPREG